MATTPPPAPPSGGVPYSEVLSRLATVSTRLSDILRTIGIGIVVFCWGLLTADKGLALDVAAHHRVWIVVTASIAVLGLFFDLLQAVVGYWVPNRLRREMECKNLAAGFYDYTSLPYRSQSYFFIGKAILMPVAAASIIVLLFMMVL